MPTSIPLIGLADSDPTPGSYVEIDFAQGAPSSGTAVYKALLIGGMLSTGSATPDTVIYGPDTPVQMAVEQDVINLFGAGSEIHRQWRDFVAINPTTPVYAIAVSEGAGAAAGTGTITVTGPATNAGALRVFVGTEFVDTGFATGATATTIAAATCTSINSKSWWPVTAANTAGVITLTAKQQGTRGNWVRYFAQMLPSTSGAGVTPTASTAVSGGATSDSNATALTTIDATRFYYLVSAAEDSTQVGALLGQVNTMAQPITGLTQRCFAGATDTLSNATTITTALNGARAEVGWLYQSDLPPCELAATLAAVYSLFEAPAIPRCNFSGFGTDAVTQASWTVKAPRSGAVPTRSQIEAALNSGITPIGVLAGGATYLVKRVTTRFMSGAVVDYRIRDAHKVTICDRYADDLRTKQALQFAGKLVGDDPVKNQDPDPIVVTPRNYLALINALTHQYANYSLLQNVDAIIAGTLAIREASPRTRLSSQIPLQTVDILDQTAALILQVA
jgi:phage tail sheath gpL-like